MSENLKRSNPDFSKYDSMSIGELEEILRADAQGPERDDSDVDEILYVMEVLAKKRRQNGIAGKTALEAYQEFQQHYLLTIKEEESEPVPKRKSNVIPFKRIAAVAASLVLVFSLATSANAFGWKDIWNVVARWAEETFSFSMGVEVCEPKADNDLAYESLSELLNAFEITDNIAPTWFPSGYILTDITISESPIQDVYLAYYCNGSNKIKISIKTFLEYEPEQLEKSDELIEVYTVDGVNYYFLSNNNQAKVTWIAGSFECYIAGDLSVEELKEMIDSI